MILEPPDPPYPDNLPPTNSTVIEPVPPPAGSIDLLIVGRMMVNGGTYPGLSHQWYINT